ncbi:MAG: GDSL-type esterase/lipase family protein [Planctomycetota bacterium]
MGRRPGSASPLARTGFITLGVLFGLMATELLLQGWAYVAWQRRPIEGVPRPDVPAVLCVGDSFTYGMGASRSDWSYPSRLATRLGDDHGLDVEVVNCGWIGQTSTDVLKRLPGQLRRCAPKVVCILCGINDFGWQTQLIEPPDEGLQAEDSFPLKFRLARLAQAFGNWLGGGPAYARERQEHPFVGMWHDGANAVHIKPSGELVADWGAEQRNAYVYGINLRWRLDGGRLLLDVPVHDAFDTQWQMNDGKLSLLLPGSPKAIELEPGPPPETASGSGLTQDEARTLAARFRAGGHNLGEDAARALAVTGLVDEALEVCLEMQAAELPVPHTAVLMQASLDPARHAALQEAIARALADERATGGLRALMLRVRFWALKDREPEAALLALLESDFLVHDPTFTRVNLQRAEFSPELLDRSLDHLDATEEQRLAIKTLRSEAKTGTDGAEGILIEHLKRAMALCRENGAEPVLLTYPFHAPRHRQLITDLAATTETRLVPVRAAFERLLEHEPWEKLFVVDGHCADRGYDEIARSAAEAVAEIVR